MRTDPGSGGHIMFPAFCQSVLLAFGQRTHISHDHHSRGQCCSSASISYDVPCMGVISYQKTFASALSRPDDTEEFELLPLASQDIEDKIRGGVIWDGMTLAAWHLVQAKRPLGLWPAP